MKTGVSYLLIGFIVLFFFSRCNTLENIQTIDLEVFVPANVIFPPGYNNVAVRYNNSNAPFNQWFSEYYIDSLVLSDTINIDSIASEIYFQNFLATLRYQNFFDSVFLVEPGNFSETRFSAELVTPGWSESDTSPKSPGARAAFELASILSHYPADSLAEQTKVIDPELGLYNKNDLQQIADSTGCDILLSFDLFTSIDGMGYVPEASLGYHRVYILAFWNFFDLNTKEPQYFYNRVDTILWQTQGTNALESMQNLPIRKERLKEAAQLSAQGFAEFLIPHWTKVQRMYYTSGHIELKKTDNLISEGKWLKAAEIWKANIDNENEKIAAKSMFNLALASEMEGHLDAAIDWAVKSYHVFGEKNKLHATNCKEYIRILSTRKRDLKLIEQQIKL